MLLNINQGYGISIYIASRSDISMRKGVCDSIEYLRTNCDVNYQEN